MLINLTNATERYTGNLGEEYFAQQSTVAQNLALWNRFIWEPHISPQDDVLDFGCGPGYLLSSLQAHRKVGIEINPAAVKVARQLGIEVCSSTRDLPSQSFSKIISSHALEHVVSPHDILVELRRLLRPSGVLCLLLPIDDWRTYSQRYFDPNDFDRHLYTWTPKSLGNLLLVAGFSVKSINIITHATAPIGGKLLWSLHPVLFHSASYIASVLLKRRQLFARATIE